MKPAQPLSWRQRWWLRWKQGFKSSFKFLFAVVLGYLLIALVGLFPVNRDFQPSDNGIEIFVSSTSIHSDIIVPVQTELINWRVQFPAECFAGDCTNATHLAVG